MRSSDLRPGPAEAVGIASPEPPTPADIPAPVTPPTPDPQSLLFRTDHLHDDLKGRSVRGGAATLGGQAANFVLKLGSTAVLARLLTPADYGLIAMVTAVTGFVEMFKDAGLSMATVQRAEINHRQVSTLFWFNLGLSFLLMLVVMALAPGVAWFYGEPQLLWITVALGTMFPLGGLTIQHGALLRRQMRFGAIASIDLASNAVGIAAGITAAAFGARYWALVTMMAASGLTGVILTCLACPWLPGLPVRGSGVRPMLAFGGNLTGFNFINYWARNADNMLIGWYWGAGPLGLYSRAYSLLTAPLSQLNAPVAAVAIPAMSRLQRQGHAFARYYLNAISILVTVTSPLIAMSYVGADEIVLVVLGRSWLEAATLFRLLALSAIVTPMFNSFGWLFTASGRTDRMLKWGFGACPLILLSFAAGLPFGARGVAIAYSMTIGALFFPGLWFATRGTPLTPGRVIRVMWPQVFASVTSAAGVAMLTCEKHIADDLANQPFLSLLAKAAAIMVGYIIVLHVLRKGQVLYDLVGVLRHVA